MYRFSGTRARWPFLQLECYQGVLVTVRTKTKRANPPSRRKVKSLFLNHEKDANSRHEKDEFNQTLKDLRKHVQLESRKRAETSRQTETEMGKTGSSDPNLDFDALSLKILVEINRGEKTPNVHPRGSSSSSSLSLSPYAFPNRRKNASVSNSFNNNKSDYDSNNGKLVIPATITQKLGLAFRYLVSQKSQNWPMVFHQLEEAGGFVDVPPKDIRILLRLMPKSQLLPLIPTVERLLKDANLEITLKIGEIFLEAYVRGTNKIDIEKLKQMVEYSRTKNTIKKGNIRRQTYELAIVGAGKSGNLDAVNYFLKEMKQQGLEPLHDTFSNVLKTCVHKAKDHKQAVQLFDSMKFFSQKTQPKLENYEDIILLYVNNNEQERALDLWEEVKTLKLEPTQRMLSTLARASTMSRTTRGKAWDFIFEIHDYGWKPTFNTFETMIYLAASDGDVGLARALYSKLEKQSPKAFSFLMLSYANYEQSKIPIINFTTKGHKLRDNLLNSFDGGAKLNIPFLPILEDFNSQQIIAETSAIWAFATQEYPYLITPVSTDIFLKVAVNHGDLITFTERYEKFTKIDMDGVAKTRVIHENFEAIDESTDARVEPDSSSNNQEMTSSVEKEKEEEQEEEIIVGANDISEVEEKDDAVNKKLQELYTIEDLDDAEDLEMIEDGEQYSNSSDDIFDNSMVSDIPNRTIIDKIEYSKVYRNTAIYETALAAAAKFKKYEFAQNTWKERGLLRKSRAFRQLSRKEKDKQDFKFAQAMVNTLVDLAMLTDALAVVVSTEYQFRWNWKHLSKLYHSGLEIGDPKITTTCKNVSSRSLIKFEGRISRKVYKQYVAKRGF